MPKTLFCTFLPDRIESFYHFHFCVGLVEWTVCEKSVCSEQRVSVCVCVGGGGSTKNKSCQLVKSHRVFQCHAVRDVEVIVSLFIGMN